MDIAERARELAAPLIDSGASAHVQQLACVANEMAAEISDLRKALVASMERAGTLREQLATMDRISEGNKADFDRMRDRAEKVEERARVAEAGLKEWRESGAVFDKALSEKGLPIYPLEAISFLKTFWKDAFLDGLNIHAWKDRARLALAEAGALRDGIAKAIEHAEDGNEASMLAELNRLADSPGPSRLILAVVEAAEALDAKHDKDCFCEDHGGCCSCGLDALKNAVKEIRELNGGGE